MKFLKGILLFAAGVITATTVSVMAEQVTKTINVFYRDIKIYADGNLVNTSNGNEAFIYNGTTYLPVRAVGEAFNKSVDWDAENSAVYLGKYPSNSVNPAVLLEDMDYFTKTADIYDLQSDGKDNTGKVHSSGITLSRGASDRGFIQYLLNGQYSRFKGIVGISYEGRDNRLERILKIYGDGKLLYSSSTMTAGVKPEGFDIDISGVQNLEIELESDYLQKVQIYDAGFYS